MIEKLSLSGISLSVMGLLGRPILCALSVIVAAEATVAAVGSAPDVMAQFREDSRFMV